MKILLSAYACEPNRGSEPGVGWNWAKQMAGFADVWVITRLNNKAAIESELREHPVPALHFVYYDIATWLRFWKKKERGLYLYYVLWQMAAYVKARKLHDNHHFDVVHHVTFGNLWLPTFMPFLGIRFIWGPIGGGEQVPILYRSDYSARAKFEEFMRDTILATLSFNPFFLLAFRNADLVLTRTQNTFEKVRGMDRHKRIKKMVETGVEKQNLFVKSGAKGNRFLKVISVGRLIHWKGLDLALRAFARAFGDNSTARMLIVGDGPDKTRLQEICLSERIIDKVDFVGYLAHEKVLEHMSQSSIFLMPSLKEGGSWVLLEAMTCGLPIICLDIAGASEIVNDKCGIKITPDTPAKTVQELTGALLKLAHDYGLRKRMGEVGRKRVRSLFCWDKKGEFIRELYERLDQ